MHVRVWQGISVRYVCVNACIKVYVCVCACTYTFCAENSTGRQEACAR